MAYRFLLQIVDAKGEQVVLLPGGSRLEADLVRAVTDAAVSRGVGMFRTEARVKTAIHDAFYEVLSALKKETRPLVP